MECTSAALRAAVAAGLSIDLMEGAPVMMRLLLQHLMTSHTYSELVQASLKGSPQFSLRHVTV